MEAAVAGAAAEVGRVGRRIIQRLWDPEPINSSASNDPVWCLGCSYTLHSRTTGPSSKSVHDSDNADSTKSTHSTTVQASAPDPASTPPSEPVHPSSLPTSSQAPDTPPDSVASSFDSFLAYEEPAHGGDVHDGGWPPAFLDDFESRIWMTYRYAFPLIPRSSDPRASSALSFTMRLKTSFGDQNGFTSDAGWGCMIRSGQSLLANAISMSRLGREWRRSKNPDDEREIISLFADDPRAAYSIHNFVQHGAFACGKYPGEWFGPSATARCIQSLANAHEPFLRVYASGDMGDVYEDSFMEVANPDGTAFHPTLILVCTRLGTDAINQVYEEALIATLQMQQSIGIAGGRPSSSHYFVGAQGRWLFYLDPHHPRPTLPYYQDPARYSTAELDTCHTRRLRHINVRDMDPSMLIGFLIRDEEDWYIWKASVKHVQGKAIINVLDHDPAKGMASGRAGAIDEVETISDDGDTVLGV